MKKLLFVTSFVSIYLFIGSCGESSSSGTVDLMTAGKESVPQIASTVAAASVEANTDFADVNDGNLEGVVDMFKFGCHTTDNSVDYCTEVGAENTDETALTTNMLIGMIQHSQMYMDNIDWTTCEGTAITPVYTPSGSDLYIIDIPDLFHATSGSKVCGISGTQYSGVVSRRQEYAPQPAGTYSDIFQSYVRNSDTGSPVILGFNLASYSVGEDNGEPYTQRSILISNMTDHKFVVKSCSTPTACYMALGIAGWDPVTNAWATGYYMVKNISDSTTTYFCLQNGMTAVVDSTGDSCSAYDPYFEATDYWSTLVTFLGLTTADQAALINFKPFLQDADALSADDIPSDATSGFPTAIGQ